MNREQFEHVIRAAADVVDDDIIVIGSQAILAEHPDAPETLLRSAELDVFPKTKLDAADDIDGAMGDGSPFHDSYGYYAHSVGPESLTAPDGWQDRLIRVEVRTTGRAKKVAAAWCLSTLDVVLSKLAAGRAHDLEFVDAAIAANLVDTEQLKLGVDLLPEGEQETVRQRLDAALARTGRLS